MHEIRIDPLTGLRAIVALDATTAVAPAPVLAEATAVALLTADAPDPPPQDNPELFAALAARGSHEVLEHGEQPVRSLAELAVQQARAAVEVWRERMRAHAGAAYVHLCVDEGRAGREGGGRVALASPALRARLRARRGRPRT